MAGKKLFCLIASMLALLPVLCTAVSTCGDVFAISFNEQKLLPSLYFNTGGPSTITVKSMTAQEYYFSLQYLPGEKWNNTKSFDVIAADPYNQSKQGEIYFQEPGQNYYSKSMQDKVYYNCSSEGMGSTDEFQFSFQKDAEINLAGGRKIVADYAKISAKRLPAFRVKNDWGTSELFVLTSRVSDEYDKGMALYKNAAGEFEKLSLPQLGFGYPRAEYVGCCAGLDVAFASPSPSAPPLASPTAFPSPIPSPSLTPSLAPSVIPSPSSPSQAPSPAASQPLVTGIDLTSLLVILAIILVAFVAVAFTVLRKPAKTGKKK